MTVTPLEHTAIGALGGSVEVVLMQPMMAFKNALQEGRPIPRNPIDMYRGLTVSLKNMFKTALGWAVYMGCYTFQEVGWAPPLFGFDGPPLPLPALQLNIMSMAPITASQFGTNRVMQQLLLGKADGELSGPQKFLAAATAGGVSALIASPTELIIIQQQVCWQV
jgi:hypothetical protein